MWRSQQDRKGSLFLLTQPAGFYFLQSVVFFSTRSSRISLKSGYSFHDSWKCPLVSVIFFNIVYFEAVIYLLGYWIFVNNTREYAKDINLYFVKISWSSCHMTAHEVFVRNKNLHIFVIHSSLCYRNSDWYHSDNGDLQGLSLIIFFPTFMPYILFFLTKRDDNMSNHRYPIFIQSDLSKI